MIRHLSIAAILMVLSVSAQGGVILDETHTTQAAFEGYIGSVRYTEEFALSDSTYTNTTLSFPTASGADGQGFSFDISGVFSATNSLSVFKIKDGTVQGLRSSSTLTVAFTGNDVTAFGGDFRGVSGISKIEFLFTDNSTETTQITTASELPTWTFMGFTSELAIQSVTISTTSESFAPALDNLVLGTAPSTPSLPLPSPGVLALLASGLIGIGFAARRNA